MRRQLCPRPMALKAIGFHLMGPTWTQFRWTIHRRFAMMCSAPSTRIWQQTTKMVNEIKLTIFVLIKCFQKSTMFHRRSLQYKISKQHHNLKISSIIIINSFSRRHCIQKQLSNKIIRFFSIYLMLTATLLYQHNLEQNTICNFTHNHCPVFNLHWIKKETYFQKKYHNFSTVYCIGSASCLEVRSTLWLSTWSGKHEKLQ